MRDQRVGDPAPDRHSIVKRGRGAVPQPQRTTTDGSIGILPMVEHVTVDPRAALAGRVNLIFDLGLPAPAAAREVVARDDARGLERHECVVEPIAVGDRRPGLLVLRVALHRRVDQRRDLDLIDLVQHVREIDDVGRRPNARCNSARHVVVNIVVSGRVAHRDVASSVVVTSGIDA
jgi:hypothetical protein